MTTASSLSFDLLSTWVLSKDPKWLTVEAKTLSQLNGDQLSKLVNLTIDVDWGDGLAHLRQTPSAAFLFDNPAPSNFTITPLMRAAHLAKPSCTRLLCQTASQEHLIHTFFLSAPSPKRSMSLTRNRLKSIRYLIKSMLKIGAVPFQQGFLDASLDLGHPEITHELWASWGPDQIWPALLSSAAAPLGLSRLDRYWRHQGFEGLSPSDHQKLMDLAQSDLGQAHLPSLRAELSRLDLEQHIRSNQNDKSAPVTKKRRV